MHFASDNTGPALPEVMAALAGANTGHVPSYGADDIDGTVRHELIYHDAGAMTPEVLSVTEIRRLISDAGREPVERDTLYRRVHRRADDLSVWSVGDPYGGTA